MIRHLFKLAWRRKSSSALLLVELLASFLVVFVVATSVVYLAGCWRSRSASSGETSGASSVARTEDQRRHLDAGGGAGLRLPPAEGASIEGVAAIAGSMNAPYDRSTMSGEQHVGGREVIMEYAEITDAARDVLRLDLVAGAGSSPPTTRCLDAGRRRRAVRARGVRRRDPVGKVFGDAVRTTGTSASWASSPTTGKAASVDPVGFVMRRTPVGRDDVRRRTCCSVRAAPASTPASRNAW